MSLASLEVAKREAWLELDQKALARVFRAFVLLSLQVAPLSAEPRTLGELGPHLYSTPDRNAAGSAIARTLVLLAPRNVLARSDIVTEESEKGSGEFETGAAPLLIVLLATASALAAAYLGNVVGESVHAVNFDDEVTKRMLSTQARAIEVLSMHVERERIAGRELPFDETERQLLVSLEDTQRKLATLQRRPLPTPFEGATEFARSATASLLPLGMLLMVSLYVLNNPQRRN
ncbi:hypothetical protein KEG38_32145 [Polyangium jinanense]|uniref:hypothetical protein n=1 Tax=Polyangium jinanense TaxID=2829994 RepID=UPI002341181C|nr:hypothetical protein [Polyangium jinanense]MDC3958551.1 hypothetical protein [Polyangium jinanense]